MTTTTEALPAADEPVYGYPYELFISQLGGYYTRSVFHNVADRERSAREYEARGHTVIFRTEELAR